MNHSDIEKLITEAILNAQAEQPSAEELRSLVAGLPVPGPVKPLPSNTALTWLAGSLFGLFSVAAGLVVGLEGFDHLSVLNRILYYSGIAICGMLLSAAAVQIAMPGSRVVVPLPLAVVGTCLGVALLVAAMFRNFWFAHFLADGIPCLLLGCGCAILFGSLSGFFLRKAYVTDSRATAIVIGTVSGFSGVAVLSLHCPIPNAAHIIVWHLGVVAVAAAAGLLISVAVRRIGWF